MNAHTAISELLHDLPTAATETFLALFPIVNPFGGIPLFFSLTADFTPEERHKTALKTSLYVIAILIVFMLFGRFVLNFFGISLPVLKIAAADRREYSVGNGDWFQSHHDGRKHAAMAKDDISLTPMAMPMLSGPGSIGVIMGLAADADHFLSYIGMLIGIVALGLSVYLCLSLGGPLVKRLGPNAVGR